LQTLPQILAPQNRHLQLEGLLLGITAFGIDGTLGRGKGCHGIEVCFARLVRTTSREDLAGNRKSTLDAWFGGIAGLDNSRDIDKVRGLGSDSKIGRSCEATDLHAGSPAAAENRHTAPIALCLFLKESKLVI
jgi:hypothetical protein